MSVARMVVISLLVVTACSGCRGKKSKAVAEKEWDTAWLDAPDAWWKNWLFALGGKLPFGPGTQFEVETLGPNGIRQTELIEVISIAPEGRRV